jgi:hypothetical protein
MLCSGDCTEYELNSCFVVIPRFGVCWLSFVRVVVA